MASKVDICNRALQKLGAKRIVAITDNSVSARACNACYDVLLDAELRKNRWNFAILRASIAADLTAPTWGRANSFTLPADFITLANDYPETASNLKDWVIESGKILTNDAAPLQVRYISRVTNVDLMDALFRESLAASMASEMCEEITQSNTKKATADADYEKAIRLAKKANAIENVPVDSPDHSWVTGRA